MKVTDLIDILISAMYQVWNYRPFLLYRKFVNLILALCKICFTLRRQSNESIHLMYCRLDQWPTLPREYAETSLAVRKIGKKYFVTAINLFQLFQM
jgi:hypothetical protein